MADCLICNHPLAGVISIDAISIFDCPRCGRFQPFSKGGQPLEGGLSTLLGPWSNKDALMRRARLSHIVRRRWRSEGHVGVPLEELPSWGLDNPLPTPAEQLDDLVVRIAEDTRSPGFIMSIPKPEIAAYLGTTVAMSGNEPGFEWLLQTAQLGELVRWKPLKGDDLQFSLTMAGWERAHELRKVRSVSRAAFMAMSFNDEMAAAFKDCFRPAIERTGFRLKTVADEQKAGLIDDQIRTGLRTSRFAVVDLTHGNQGAYWEAGFAEGLGRPVVYTCRREEWDAKKTHFDTNHLKTVIWDPAKLKDAEDELAATVRATLPDEAKLED